MKKQSQRAVIHPLFNLRFGHSQVNTHLWRYEEDGTMSPYGHLPLRDAYFSPERVTREGGIDPLFRGAVKQAAQEVDLKVCSPFLVNQYFLFTFLIQTSQKESYFSTTQLHV